MNFLPGCAYWVLVDPEELVKAEMLEE